MKASKNPWSYVLCDHRRLDMDGVWIMRLRAPHSWATSAFHDLVAGVLHFVDRKQKHPFPLVCKLWSQVYQQNS